MPEATMVETTMMLSDGIIPVESDALCDSVSGILGGAPRDKPSTDTRIEGVCWIVCYYSYVSYKLTYANSILYSFSYM